MKKQITFKLLMLSSLIAGIFFLNGCATHHLWWKERDQDLDKYRSIGKAGQIYITDDSENEKNLRLCIPFDVKKWGKIDGDILFPPFESVLSARLHKLKFFSKFGFFTCVPKFLVLSYGTWTPNSNIAVKLIQTKRSHLSGN